MTAIIQKSGDPNQPHRQNNYDYDAEDAITAKKKKNKEIIPELRYFIKITTCIISIHNKGSCIVNW